MTLARYLAYFLLAAGALTFLVAWSGKSRQPLSLVFGATMMVMGGLVILHFLGTEAPGY